MSVNSNFVIRAFDGKGWGEMVIANPHAVSPMSFRPLSPELGEKLEVPSDIPRGVLVFSANPNFPADRKPCYAVVPYSPEEYLKRQNKQYLKRGDQFFMRDGAKYKDANFEAFENLFASLGEHSPKIRHVPFANEGNASFVAAQSINALSVFARGQTERLGLRRVATDITQGLNRSTSHIASEVVAPSVSVPVDAAHQKTVTQLLADKGLYSEDEIQRLLQIGMKLSETVKPPAQPSRMLRPKTLEFARRLGPLRLSSKRMG